MARKTYDVTLYRKHCVFDKNLNLVWRWHKSEKYTCTTQREAIRRFYLWNHSGDRKKAVLRAKEEKRHVKK